MPGAQVYVNGAHVRQLGLGGKPRGKAVALEVEQAWHHHQRLDLKQHEVDKGDGEVAISSPTADIQDSSRDLGTADLGLALSIDCRVVFGRRHLFRFDVYQGTAQSSAWCTILSHF